MSTASEDILARYSKIQREADSLGRMIGVKRLRPSQQLRISEWTDAKTDEGAAAFKLAASVCEIDGTAITFPRNRGELDSILDALDTDGLAAASIGIGKLMGILDADGKLIDKDSPDGAKSVEDAAKNS